MVGTVWTITGRGWDLVLATHESTFAGAGSPLTIVEARRLLSIAQEAEPAWSLRVRAIGELARALRGRFAGDDGTNAWVTVHRALAAGVVRAWRVERAVIARPEPDALDAEAVLRIPLASDLLEATYEKGIEFEAVFEDEDFCQIVDELEVEAEEFDSIEEECEAEVEEFDSFEEESEGEPETDDSFEETALTAEQGETFEDEREGYVEGAAAAPSTTEAGLDDGAIETEDEVEEEQFDTLEDDSEVEEPDDAEQGDAGEPIDEPDAA